MRILGLKLLGFFISAFFMTVGALMLVVPDWFNSKWYPDIWKWSGSLPIPASVRRFSSQTRALGIVFLVLGGLFVCLWISALTGGAELGGQRVPNVSPTMAAYWPLLLLGLLSLVASPFGFFQPDKCIRWYFRRILSREVLQDAMPHLRKRCRVLAALFGIFGVYAVLYSVL